MLAEALVNKVVWTVPVWDVVEFAVVWVELNVVVKAVTGVDEVVFAMVLEYEVVLFVLWVKVVVKAVTGEDVIVFAVVCVNVVVEFVTR